MAERFIASHPKPAAVPEVLAADSGNRRANEGAETSMDDGSFESTKDEDPEGWDASMVTAWNCVGNFNTRGG